MSIFISYSSADEAYARVLYNALKYNGFDPWFAPEKIKIGENFLSEIDEALQADMDYERYTQETRQIPKSQCFLVLISGNSTNLAKSQWVYKELLLAIKRGIPIKPIRIDRYELPPEFEGALIDIQWTDAYHMNSKAVNKLIDDLKKEMPEELLSGPVADEKRLTYEDIGIFPIGSGDPYFTYGKTLKVTLTDDLFYLSPPRDLMSEDSVIRYLNEHTFHSKDEVFASSLKEECSRVPIPGLYDMVEKSRRKIFQQFLNKENGCHFNNEKYGVESISNFEREETIAEEPVLRIDLFVTDYYTHRVMKDVCKQIAVSMPSLIREFDFNNIGAARILFTSLGINLVLTEENKHILLTSRSTNAAETYDEYLNALSVIEGVSASDYDLYEKTVNIEWAVFRGLREELGVTDEYILKDTLKFYDMFYNPNNYEMGLSCSIEVRPEYSLENDIKILKGKDEALELAGKSVVSVGSLKKYIRNNLNVMMPQAIFTLCSYLETIGIQLVDRMHHAIVRDTTSVIAKNGTSDLCGDAYVWSDEFIAVIDGATPKGERLWNGQKGDVFVSHLVAKTIGRMNAEINGPDAISYINDSIRSAYAEHEVNFNMLEPEERLQCSVLIYSKRRHQIWSFGDCMLKINKRQFNNIKDGEKLFSALRAFCIQIEKDRRGKSANPEELSAYGREAILPYLKEYITLANRNVPFGYNVIDGSDEINPDHVEVYEVQRGDTVVMASDGYPELFDTLEETEQYLLDALEIDSICINKLRGTKGVTDGNQSYDDRTYVSFRVR